MTQVSIAARRILWIFGGALLVGGPAAAQDARPLRIIVPYSAGGPTDILARLMVPRMSERLGRPVVIENQRSVVAGLLATSRLEPDGNAVGMFGNSITTLPVTMKDFTLDLNKDLTAIAQVAEGTMNLIVSSTLPVSGVKELISYARANPGRLNFGSASQDLVMRMFNGVAGIDVAIIPYNGSAAVAKALLAGEVQLAFQNMASVKTLMQSGKVRLIGIAGRARDSQFPDVPTLAEAGIQGVTYVYWYGMYGPPGLPAATTARLSEAAQYALRTPDMSKRAAEMDARITLGSAADFARVTAEEVDQWAKAAKAFGIKPQ